MWCYCDCCFFFFSSRRRHTRSDRDWSSDVCSSDLCVGRALSSPWRRVGVGESGGRGRILGHFCLRPALRACSKKSTTLPRQMHLLQGDPCNEDPGESLDRKSTRLNSSHDQISYAVFCLKKKNGDPIP